MERELIVSLLQKNIQELGMITEGFMGMTEYPAVIIQLARQKTEDILDYVHQLEEIKREMKPQEPIVVPITTQEPAEPEPEKESVEVEKTEFIEYLPIVEEEIPSEELIIESKEEESIEEEDVDDELDVELQEEFEQELLEEELQESIEIAEEDLIEEDLIEEIVIVEKILEEELSRQPIDEKEILEEQEEQKEEFFQSEINNAAKKAVKTTDNTIAGVHTNKKIDDIRHAISIGDRFRFQRELFDGNGELMNKTLFKLNQMNDFHEASAYLQSKFKWKEEDETVENFYQIVKRRYL